MVHIELIDPVTLIYILTGNPEEAAKELVEAAKTARQNVFLYIHPVRIRVQPNSEVDHVLQRILENSK